MLEIILKSIDKLPDIFQYFFPGYIFLLIFTGITSKEINNDTKIIVSCALSYMLLSFSSLLANISFFRFVNYSVLIKSAFSIMLGVVLSIAISLILRSKWFPRLMIKWFHNSLNDTIWLDVLDLENGSNIKLYIKEVNYYVYGHFKCFENKGNNSWVAIACFTKTRIADDVVIEKHDDCNDVFLIRISDVKYVEIYN